MLKKKANSEQSTRVLRLRLKDKHATSLREKAFWVNQVWNYCNALSFQVWERERRFLSGYDFAQYTRGATKEGLPLHSQTVQAIAEEYATRRKQCKRVKLRWRVSSGRRRSLGWMPFKASALRYRNGQLFLSGLDQPLSLWDSYGLSNYTLGAGWSTVRTMLQYKCDDAGVWFEEVNESYSTLTCSCCAARTGPRGLPGLSVRAGVCSACGSAHDRDVNAAQNILQRGLEGLEKSFAAAACQADVNKVVAEAAARVGRDPLVEGISVL